MKRSKVFLGITTGVLAVVAFTAAKSAKFTNRLAGYHQGLSHCTVAAGVTGYTTNSGSGVKVKQGGVTVYSYTDAAACSNPLFTSHKSGD